MEKKNMIVVYVAAAHMLLSMMAMIIETRKRKRHGDQIIISLDHEHYRNHFKDERNKGDDEFIKKPLPYYDEGDNVQKEGFFATSSAVHENDIGATSALKPPKRVKREDSGTEILVEAFQQATQTLATAIKKAASKPLPPGLFQAVDSIPGFEVAHKSKYYSHLVANPDIAYAFMDVPLLYKISMVTDFVNEKF